MAGEWLRAMDKAIGLVDKQSTKLDDMSTRYSDMLDAAIDRLVWYAGWADKLTQVVGNANPVAGPYFNLSTPEPSGVIAVVAPKGPLLGLVSVVAPLIVTGNTVVVIASEAHPLTAITLGEVMATSPQTAPSRRASTSAWRSLARIALIRSAASAISQG